MKDQILEEYKKGNVVIATFDGIEVCKMEDFLNQTAEGMLYDLNRNETTILTFVDKDPKWINDYALSKTIIALKKEITRLKSLLEP